MLADLFGMEIMVLQGNLTARLFWKGSTIASEPLEGWDVPGMCMACSDHLNKLACVENQCCSNERY